MRIYALGCHGGETPHHRTTCFLVDERVCIDAGAICRGLELDAQRQIDHILISHSHMDHVKDLALLADQVIGARTSPVYLHCGPETAETLRTSYFNNYLWPDFTKIPSAENPVMKIVEHMPEEPFIIEVEGTEATRSLEVTFVPVSHPVESMAMFLRDDAGCFFYSSDTGPTERLWEVAQSTADLIGGFVELSFPNSMQGLADVSGHYTPATLSKELARIEWSNDIPLFVYHFKPGFYDETERDFRSIGLDNIHMVHLEQEYRPGPTGLSAASKE